MWLRRICQTRTLSRLASRPTFSLNLARQINASCRRTTASGESVKSRVVIALYDYILCVLVIMRRVGREMPDACSVASFGILRSRQTSECISSSASLDSCRSLLQPVSIQIIAHPVQSCLQDNVMLLSCPIHHALFLDLCLMFRTNHPLRS